MYARYNVLKGSNLVGRTKRMRLITGCIMYLFFSDGSLASPGEASWNTWLLRQIDDHPDLVAARQHMNATFSHGDDMTRPLYNPEFETAYERQGDANNYRFGIRQTFDWWDKRGERTLQSESVKVAARQAYLQTRQDKLAQALRALVRWEAAGERYQLAIEQEEQLDALIALVKRRQRAGDLGQIDVELTLLTLSQRLYDTAQAMSAFQEAEATLRELLPAWLPGQQAIPVGTWVTETLISTDDGWLDDHPSVLAAKAQWEIQQQQAQLTRLEAKAEPTVGFDAGREDTDAVVGLTLSVPLNVRNNYSARTRAASQQALSAEAAYRAVRRQLRYALQADSAVVEQYRAQVTRWHSLMSERRDQSRRLLERQWNAGDLSTTEYLLTLQQGMDGLMAGISLNEQYRLAVVRWLSTSGQVVARLSTSSVETKGEKSP